MIRYMTMLFPGEGSFISDGNFAPRLIRGGWKLSVMIHLLGMAVVRKDSFFNDVDKTI